MKNNWLKRNIWALIVPLGVFVDQISKFLAKKYITSEVVIIKNFFSFTLTFNEGAAWSILESHPIILKLISILACAGIAAYYFLGKNNNLTKIGLALLYAGALGNGIDRVIFSKVTDFINVNIFIIFDSQFPIFNIADLLVTAGAIVVLVSVLFFEKDK